MMNRNMGEDRLKARGERKTVEPGRLPTALRWRIMLFSEVARQMTLRRA